MNKLRLASSLLFSAVFALSASCGSDDGDGSTSTGGTGTGGAGNAGSTAKGGTTSTGGGGGSTTGGSAGNTSVAGSGASGGTRNTGGAGGGAVAAGAGGDDGNTNPFSCPTAKPTAGDECSRPSTQPCDYDDGACACRDDVWSCYSDSDCPAQAPANEEACNFSQMNCAYGELNCVCSTTTGWSCQTPCPATKPATNTTACTRPADQLCRYGEDGQRVSGFGTTAASTCSCVDGKLNCFSQADCPADPPANDGACTTPTLGCSYTGRQCNCGTDGTWSCTTDCPEATPAAASACLRAANQACSYAAGALVSGGATPDTTCVCIDEKFTCYTDADCPAERPEAGACTQLGLNCNYETAEETSRCRCRTSTSEWSCSSFPNQGSGGNDGSGGAPSSAGGAGGTSGM